MPPMPSGELTRVLAAASPAEGRRWSGDGGCRHGGARKPLPHAGGAGCAPRRLPQLGCRRWLTCAWGVWHAARPRRELAHVTAGRLAVAGWMGRGACLPRADVCVTSMRGWPGRVSGYATKPPPLLEQATCVDTCGIRAHAGRPHRLSRPMPWPLGQSVT